MENRYAVIHIEGGIGKNVMATAVVRAISKSYPERKIVVVTAYPEVWECNPRIYRAISFSGTEYFYEDYVDGKETIFFLQDPYRHTGCINRTRHLTDVWCEICGVEWDGPVPEMYFTRLESEFIQSYLSKDSRPILLIHPFGGADTSSKYSWARDIHPSTIGEIVRELSGEYRIIQARREDQILVDGAESLTTNARQLALCALHSDKRLLIDSYMQHACAALGLKSTVVWIGNSPTVFGYEENDNIIVPFERGSIRSSLYEPFALTGNPTQLATPTEFLFDKNKIIQSIRR